MLTFAFADTFAVDSEPRLPVDTPVRPPFLPGGQGQPFQLPPLDTQLLIEGPKGQGEFLLKRVVFSGNTVISTHELERVAAPYIDKSITAAEIEDLRRKITLHYIERGYVNSGALLATEAPLGEGELAFRIVEGKVSRVEIRGLERLENSYVADRLNPVPDEPLNLGTLRERFQLLLDDPLFAKINARIVPDAQAGEAILDLDVVRARPYQLTLYTNDYRPPSTGANAIGFNGNVRNLSGHGDVLEFNYQESAQGKPGSLTQLGWRVPLNRVGTSVSFRALQGQSTVVEAPLNALNITSRLDSIDIGVSQPIFESLAQKLSIGLNSVDETIRSTLLGQGFSFTPGVPDGNTKAHVWKLWQEYTHRTESNALVLRSTLSLEANNNLAAGTAFGVQAPARYTYWLGQFQYAQRIGEQGTQAVLKGAVQRAGSTVLPVDAISIGGVDTVRGYRENTLIRDNGVVMGFQVDVPVTSLSQSVPRIVAGPFYDWGRGSNFADSADTISSLGLALKATWRGVRFDLSIAKRLVHPGAVDSLSGSLQDKGIHFQFAYDMF